MEDCLPIVNVVYRCVVVLPFTGKAASGALSHHLRPGLVMRSRYMLMNSLIVFMKMLNCFHRTEIHNRPAVSHPLALAEDKDGAGGAQVADGSHTLHVAAGYGFEGNRQRNEAD